ncbi:MAG: hypothetical protein Q8Q14_06075 [Gemmatimonadales bacterium]|nr:hypothetical protein [Gemmatimonadales bacterium]
MIDQHEDPRFEQWLKDAAQSYHAPRPTPRDELWARIAERRRRSVPVLALRPWARWALAAAAMLVLGIGIGRWSAGGGDGASPNGTAVANDTTNRDLLYHVAATQYLSRTEAFLTGFRADLRDGQVSPRFTGQARDLLSTTRLMLDSPAADDARLRLLLQDLELVLVQISQLQSNGVSDADLITQRMDRSNVLPKLRSAIPAGPVPVRFEGAL